MRYAGADGISFLHTGRYGVTLSFPAAANLSRRYRAWGFMASKTRRTSDRFSDFGQIGQHERRDRHLHVPDRNIVVAACCDQVEGDREEPYR